MTTISKQLSRIYITPGTHPVTSRLRNLTEILAHLTGRHHAADEVPGCPVVLALARYIAYPGPEGARQMLAPRLLAIAGSANPPGMEWQRSLVLVDFLVRWHLPRRLREAAKTNSAPACDRFADLLRHGLDTIADDAGFMAAMTLLNGLSHTDIGQGKDFVTGISAAWERYYAMREHPIFAANIGIDIIKGFLSAPLYPEDAIGLLNRLLDVGPVQPLEVTPEIAQRIDELVEITSAPVPAV